MSRQQQYRTPLKLNDSVVEVKSKVSWGCDGDVSGHVSGYQMILGLVHRHYHPRPPAVAPTTDALSLSTDPPTAVCGR